MSRKNAKVRAKRAATSASDDVGLKYASFFMPDGREVPYNFESASCEDHGAFYEGMGQLTAETVVRGLVRREDKEDTGLHEEIHATVAKREVLVEHLAEQICDKFVEHAIQLTQEQFGKILCTELTAAIASIHTNITPKDREMCGGKGFRRQVFGVKDRLLLPRDIEGLLRDLVVFHRVVAIHVIRPHQAVAIGSVEPPSSSDVDGEIEIEVDDEVQSVAATVATPPKPEPQFKLIALGEPAPTQANGFAVQVHQAFTGSGKSARVDPNRVEISLGYVLSGKFQPLKHRADAFKFEVTDPDAFAANAIPQLQPKFEIAFMHKNKRPATDEEIDQWKKLMIHSLGGSTAVDLRAIAVSAAVASAMRGPEGEKEEKEGEDGALTASAIDKAVVETHARIEEGGIGGDGDMDALAKNLLVLNTVGITMREDEDEDEEQ